MTEVVKEFVVSRTFDAPVDLVWSAWSDPERLARWWGPKGSQINVVRFEFRPGGALLYSMDVPDGKWWGRFQYRDIEKPSRIIFVSSFSNEAGDVVRAPFSASWPLQVMNHLTLTEQNGKTVLTLRGGPIDPTPEEKAMFEGMFPSMQQGFSGTFDRLDAYLAQD